MAEHRPSRFLAAFLRMQAAAILAVGAAAVSLVALPVRPVHAATPADIFSRVSPAVALVKDGTGHGSGMLIDATHVMTDAHVVGEKATMEVMFPDGTIVPKARVVVRDLLVDMAILEVPRSHITPVTIGAPPPVGTDLYAIGYPGNIAAGRPQPVLTRGLVSQLATWDAAGVQYVRTDAAGEPGLSGGPLIDAAGNVVAITQTGSSSGRFVFGAGAADLLARARRELAGVDVNGIIARTHAGPAGRSFVVSLGGYGSPQQAFLIRPSSDVQVTLTATAAGAAADPTGTMIVWGMDDFPGIPAASGAIDARTPSRTVTFSAKSQRAYWFEVRSTSQTTLEVSANTSMVRVVDPDEARVSAGVSFGIIDFGGDADCRPLGLLIGQRLTATADSTLVSPALTLVSPAGVPVRAQTRRAGFLGESPEVTHTAGATGDYTLCVSADYTEGAGAYSLSIALEPAPVRSDAGQFTLLPTRLLQPRAGHFTGVLKDGRGFIADGAAADGARLASAEIFDPVEGTVRAVEARDITARYDPTGVVMRDGRVLLLGGVVAEGAPTDAASIWDPVDGSWRAAGLLAGARAYGEAIELRDGRILVFTGEDEGREPTGSAEVFDPETDRFSTTGSMITPRVGLYAALLPDGRVLAAGGQDAHGNPIRSVEAYDPLLGQFSEIGNLKTARYNHATALLPSGLVLIAGGSDGAANLAAAELFDPRTGTSREVRDLRFARQGMSTTVLPDGRVLLAGGTNPGRSGSAGPEEMTAAEIFDPTSETFLFVGGLERSRYGFGEARLLPDGSVLFAGGMTLQGRLNTIERFVPRAAPAGFSAPPVFAAGSAQAAAVFGAGEAGDLEAAAAAHGATGVWAQDRAGVFHLLVVGGPAFLNAGFSAAFPGGFDRPTAVTLTK